MCGIFGVVCDRGRFDEGSVRAALDTLTHRGPDDSDLARFEIGGREVWLGHRRLSILDLSAAGRQPMTVDGPNGPGTIIFNGELYNHRDLREALGGRHEFVSSTDTEVLLAGLLHDGPTFLEQTNAMLAFVMLEPEQRRLTVARDRVGKKPLYVYEHDGVLAFASELKAFEALGLRLTLDAEAFAYFRWMGYFPAQMTAYLECTKFDAGAFAQVDLGGDLQLDTQLYWDPFAASRRRFEGTYDDAIDVFLELLDDATRLRLDADVPVGTFLSGGVDSSLVASSIQRRGGNVRAFTVGSDDPTYNEADIARDTAERLGIPIEVLHMEPADYERQIPKIATHYDEPFADVSAIPTMAISEKAREHVTVVLTGDGGDELFCGYPWFGYPEKLWGWRKRFAPTSILRRSAAKLIGTNAGRRALESAVAALGFNTDNVDTKRLIVRHALLADSPAPLYDRFKSMWQKEWLSSDDQAVLEHQSLLGLAKSWHPDYSWASLEERTLTEQLAAVDQVTFMRDDVLVKVDRATMAYSLEARSPLLDFRIVEFACALPLDVKVKDGVYKRLLRDAVERRIGGQLSKLKKRGFGVPMPADLPAAPSPTAAWSKFAENQWRAKR